MLKLRKKLMLLFLTFIMLLFTVIMILLAYNSVQRMREAEKTYMQNIASNLIYQRQGGYQFTDKDAEYYATRSHIWFQLTNKDGRLLFSIVERFITDSATLLSRLDARQEDILVVSVGDNVTVMQSNILAIKGNSGDSYYGIIANIPTDGGGMETLTILYQHNSVKTTLWQSCGWYPLIWLTALAAIYGLSRFLIAVSLKPVEASIRSQKNFIASASHELNSPLTVIQTNTEAIQSLQLNDHRIEQKLEIIDKECRLMSNLIKNMLSLASSDAGSWNMNPTEINVDSLLIETWEAFQCLCAQKEIILELELSDDDYPVLTSDKERVAQVLGILLDNAINYSEKGSKIQLQCENDKGWLLFSVIDHAIGINDSEKEKVFERFYRADQSRSKKEHFGLGLCIAKEIVQLHHGIITLEDTPGGGCTFRVKLPTK